MKRERKHGDFHFELCSERRPDARFPKIYYYTIVYVQLENRLNGMKKVLTLLSNKFWQNIFI